MARRIFVAVEISESMKQAIYSYTMDAFGGIHGVRVIPPENLHITLRFIGDTDDEVVEKIEKATGEAVLKHKGFVYSLQERMDAFPHTGRAMIVYAGIEKGSRDFRSLYDSLQDVLFSLGIDREERVFHPHITAARIKRPFDVSGLVKEPVTLVKGDQTAGYVSIFESILGRQGPRYINIKRFVLK